MLILLEFYFFNFLRAVKLTQIYKKARNKTKLKNEDKDNFKI